MKVVFWCLAILNIADYWLTSLILKNGGYEMNPVQNWFIEQFGTIGILYFKIPLLVALGYAIYCRWDDLSTGFRPYAEVALYGCVVAYCLVIAWSTWVYLYLTS